jgi:hypothetical protein
MGDPSHDRPIVRGRVVDDPVPSHAMLGRMRGQSLQNAARFDRRTDGKPIHPRQVISDEVDQFVAAPTKLLGVHVRNSRAGG